MKPFRNACLALVALLLATPAVSAQPVSGFQRISVPGFGDRQNSYAWSMAWFKGKLYVGTCRNFLCVTLATIDNYNPDTIKYTSQPDPCVTCPLNSNDLDLRAEIWCFDPETNQWSRLYQSPGDLANPRAPGKFVARDIGFRNMIVYTEADGTEALYVGGVSARDHLGPLLPPPRMLRSTNGYSFEEVPLRLPDIPGMTIAGFRSMVQFHGKMYVTATSGLRGEGVILESDNPLGGNFRLVSDPKLQVYELAVFNDQLYVGLADSKLGYSVWRTSASGAAPYPMLPVVALGGGRGPLVSAVVSMQVFNNRLYVGANGWGSIIFPQFTELIRINPNNSWDVVVGNRRYYIFEFRQKSPISGMPDGFGNPFNAHIWRMAEHQGVLYAGTNDISWIYRGFLNWITGMSNEYGFDLFASTDGQYWAPYTKNGFSKGSDFGLRTFASTPVGLFAGTANDCEGLDILVGHSPGGDASASASSASVRMMAESIGRGNALSWEPVSHATKYQIYRSTPIKRKVPALPGSTTAMTEVSRPGPFTLVGSSPDAYYRDRTASAGQLYLYYMRAVDSRGRLSSPSNLAVVSSDAPPPAVLGDLAASVEALDVPDDGSENTALESLRTLVRKASDAVEADDLEAAARTLGELRDWLQGDSRPDLEPVAAEDFSDLVLRLQRRVELARKGIIARDDLKAPARP